MESSGIPFSTFYVYFLSCLIAAIYCATYHIYITLLTFFSYFFIRHVKQSTTIPCVIVLQDCQFRCGTKHSRYTTRYQSPM